MRNVGSTTSTTGEIMKRIDATALLAIVAALGLPAAASATTHAVEQRAQQKALSEGEVRKVDKETKKITIRHGPIANLDMPPMTMVFQVKEPSMLESVKAGDKIRFSADKIGGAYTVTQLEPAK
jgi:Cu/Ag efflux protein CusF